MSAPGRPTNPPARNGHLRSGDFMLGAARMKAEAAAASRGDLLAGADVRHAQRWEERAREPAFAEHGVSGELLPDNRLGLSRQLRNTTSDPDYVAADASRERLELAYKANALELALDAADTIEAQNSLERMLAHQLAAAHHSAMELTGQLNRCIERMDAIHEDTRERANVQGTRLAGAIARMMGSYQQGLMTLQRLRTGGRQEVHVIRQEVQVNEGGRAVIAGAISQRDGRKTEGHND